MEIAITTNKPKNTAPIDRDDTPKADRPADVTPFPDRAKTSKRASPTPVAPKVTSKKWGLDIQALNSGLPPPGRYRGVISDITFKDRGSDLFMMVGYELDGCDVAPKKDMATVVFGEGVDIDREQIVKGLELLEKLCAGIGITLNDITNDVRGLSAYIGARVLITVAHKRGAGGIIELVVRRLDPFVEE